MKASFKTGLLALAAFLTMTAAIPAHADDHGWHGRGTKYNSRNDHDYRNNRDYNRRGYYYAPVQRYPDHWVQAPYRRNVVIINNNDRVVIRDYLYNRYPPVRVKRYFIGAPLPIGVPYYPVPYELRARLAPVPYGYNYVMVDNDVLLMSQATRDIVDAVTLLALANR